MLIALYSSKKKKNLEEKFTTEDHNNNKRIIQDYETHKCIHLYDENETTRMKPLQAISFYLYPTGFLVQVGGLFEESRLRSYFVPSSMNQKFTERKLDDDEKLVLHVCARLSMMNDKEYKQM
ncbi:CLUMA_CG021586, isoform A [Clunio marinus]|uniref:CLUMA_CG021586, isoform A n=1 Tax=Clunio marinus TaxID=568069 RepID=A0A1J1JA20_9DIPT|nr:CLUMA_CG021586, isoform A [Clunio marinus]